MRVLKQFVGLFIFLTLILVKVSGFHVYAHQDCDSDTVENCDLCDLAIESQTLDFQTPDYFEIVSISELPFNKQIALKDEQSKEEALDYYLFSRPPPTPLT